MLTLENAKKVEVDGGIKYLYKGKYYTKEEIQDYFNKLNEAMDIDLNEYNERDENAAIFKVESSEQEKEENRLHLT